MDCEIFKNNRPCTISLTILVAIEMFNTFNALSENQSLLVVPPWANPWVGLAVVLSLLCHCLILYVDFFVQIFQTAPIDFNEWTIVINFSLPVIFLDEILKFITRQVASKPHSFPTSFWHTRFTVFSLVILCIWIGVVVEFVSTTFIMQHYTSVSQE